VSFLKERLFSTSCWTAENKHLAGARKLGLDTLEMNTIHMPERTTSRRQKVKLSRKGPNLDDFVVEKGSSTLPVPLIQPTKISPQST
jgi:hypothetical protein